ncbi:MAG: trigger factor [Firmicutes bacterium]|nr:trigger factor [Bacillota bacterium]
MKTEIVNREGNTVTLKVELGPDVVAKAIDRAYVIIRKDISLPGFRKGRVPRNIIEKRFGVEVFYEEAANILLQESYPGAIDEAQLDPVDKPEIDVEELGIDKPFVYTAKVTVKPEAKLGEYKGLGIARDEVSISDEDVAEQLSGLQKQKGQMVALPEGEAAQKEDQVIIDFVGRLDGEEFEGGSATNHPLVLGSNQFIPGFEDQLLGKKAGEHVVVKVTMPEEYHAEHLAGKDVEFAVDIKEIKRQELPELDDEFAKDVSEFETLEAFKANMREEMEKRALDEAEQKQRQEILTAVADNSEVDIPDVMIENELEALIRQTETRFAQQGFKFEDFLQYSGKDLEQYKQELRPNAEKNVKTELVLDALVKAESLSVSEEELDQELEKMAEAYSRNKEELKTILESGGQMAGIEQVLLHKKALDYLVEVNS